METGPVLRAARFRAGLTQQALADAGGTSQATISAYEAGRKQPSLETLTRLLAAAGSRLEVLPAAEVREPTQAELARAGRQLRDVLDLAAALPSRHGPVLTAPNLPGRPRA